MVALVVLAVVVLDAASDGWRAILKRPWTVVLGCMGDGLALWWLGIPWAVAPVAALRGFQEWAWRRLPYHKGTRWDLWHLGKQCRFLSPLVAIVALSGLSVVSVGILAVASWVLWRLALMLARGTWDWRRPWV